MFWNSQWMPGISFRADESAIAAKQNRLGPVGTDGGISLSARRGFNSGSQFVPENNHPPTPSEFVAGCGCHLKMAGQILKCVGASELNSFCGGRGQGKAAKFAIPVGCQKRQGAIFGPSGQQLGGFCEMKRISLLRHAAKASRPAGALATPLPVHFAVHGSL